MKNTVMHPDTAFMPIARIIFDQYDELMWYDGLLPDDTGLAVAPYGDTMSPVYAIERIVDGKTTYCLQLMRYFFDNITDISKLAHMCEIYYDTSDADAVADYYNTINA